MSFANESPGATRRFIGGVGAVAPDGSSGTLVVGKPRSSKASKELVGFVDRNFHLRLVQELLEVVLF